jgi:hypothetical protein
MCMWTTYRDERRFSGVRWVVVATCVPCRFCCCSTTHNLQLCGRDPIRGRDAGVLSIGRSHNRNLHAAPALGFACGCLDQVRAFSAQSRAGSDSTLACLHAYALVLFAYPHLLPNHRSTVLFVGWCPRLAVLYDLWQTALAQVGPGNHCSCHHRYVPHAHLGRSLLLNPIVIGMCFSILLLLAEWEAYDGQQDTTVPDLLNLLQFPTTLTWAVCSLVLNTVLSTSIIAKIV